MSTHAQRLILDDAMTIYTAAETKERILGALKGATALRIDLSRVQEVDSAGLQLLLLAQRDALALGVGLALDGMTPAVAEALGVFGLDETLQTRSSLASMERGQ